MKKFKSPAIHRTPMYRAKAAYCGMKRRCLNACGTEPSYANVELRMSLNEWLAWSLPRYRRFLNRHPDQSPSVSRKGDAGHYEIGNVEIVSALENRARQHRTRAAKAGKKTCSRCDKTKPVSSFSRSSNNLDGLSYWCKPCVRTQDRERKARPSPH